MMIALTPGGRLAAGRFILVILTGSFAGAVHASEQTYGVNVGVGRTDNVFLSPADPRSATFSSAGLDFSALQSGPRVNADVFADLIYMDYLHTELPNEVLGTVAAHGKFAIVPDRVEWLVDDNFGQATLNQVDAMSPENRESVNYFSTGPRLTLGLGSDTRLLLDGTYSTVNYQHSPLDSRHHAGSASVVQELSASSNVSLKVDTERIDYEDGAVNPPIDQREGVLRYEASGSRTKFRIEAGYERAKFNLQSYSKPVFQLAASRIVSPFSSVDLSFGRSFSNSGALFRQLQESRSTAQQTQSIQPTNELFTSTYAALNWRMVHNRTSFDFSVSRYKQSYEQRSVFDQLRTNIHVYFSRQLSPAMRLYASASLSKNRYDAPLNNSTDKNFSAGVTRQMGRLLSLDLEYQRYDRGGVEAVSIGNVNQVWVRLFYGTAKRHAASPGVQ